MARSLFQYCPFILSCFFCFSFAQVSTSSQSPLQSNPVASPTPTPTNCDWCYSVLTLLSLVVLRKHFSSCHQPTSAPDSEIYSKCYCDTLFQAVYTTCLDSCGWSSAGIPPLTDILQTCSGGAAPGQTSASPTVSSGNSGGTAIITTSQTSNPPKGSSIGNSTGNGNGAATSGAGDDEKDKSLLYRVEGVILGGFVLGWM